MFGPRLRPLLIAPGDTSAWLPLPSLPFQWHQIRMLRVFRDIQRQRGAIRGANVFQRGSVRWFDFYVGGFHRVTERIRGNRCMQAGRGGRSQGRKPKMSSMRSTSADEGREAEVGTGHKCPHTLNHSIIASPVVRTNVSRECAWGRVVFEVSFELILLQFPIN